MWDTLDVIHKGTSEVKRYWTNTLTEEYELFPVKNGETIAECKKKFTFI